MRYFVYIDDTLVDKEGKPSREATCSGYKEALRIARKIRTARPYSKKEKYGNDYIQNINRTIYPPFL